MKDNNETFALMRKLMLGLVVAAVRHTTQNSSFCHKFFINVWYFGCAQTRHTYHTHTHTQLTFRIVLLWSLHQTFLSISHCSEFHYINLCSPHTFVLLASTPFINSYITSPHNLFPFSLLRRIEINPMSDAIVIHRRQSVITLDNIYVICDIYSVCVFECLVCF